jgi:large subunit ribosomal protein L15
MKLHELTSTPGAARTAKRKGRGHGSGNGKTAGRGHKGQKSRAGYSSRAGFEGGQMPLQRRIPKRGFVNIFAEVYQIVNVADINERFESGATIDAAQLKKAGLISGNPETVKVKVLGNGDVTKNFTIQAAKFSETARTKIEAAGGKAEVV